MKQFFLNLREMGIVLYRDKMLLRRRDETENLYQPYQISPVGTDAAIVSHTGRGIPGVSGAAVTTLKKSSPAVPLGFTSA